MGVKIFDIIPTTQIKLKDLAGKIVVLDGNLVLHQFLSSIRQRDGSLLTDSQGNITSHLNGLFYRTSKLIASGIKVCYVFDGKPPDLKLAERERRIKIKEQAHAKFKEAEKQGDIESMKKFASRTSRLTRDMIEEAKQLVSAFGLPVVQAPSEGEAQAAHMVKKNDAYAVGSQDADSFLFGATRLVKNLSISGKRKKAGKLSYTTVEPEMLQLSDILNHLGIDHDQLIILGMLIGTDYNVGGIKGIGPKNALKIVKKHKHDFDVLFEEVGWSKNFDYKWTEVYYLIKKTQVTDDYKLEWQEPDENKISELLVEKHGFSAERLQLQLQKIIKENKQKNQKGLGDFF